MDTPLNDLYADFTQEQLFEKLQNVEEQLCGIHRSRAELNQEELKAQEHREAIQRALGVIILRRET